MERKILYKYKKLEGDISSKKHLLHIHLIL